MKLNFIQYIYDATGNKLKKITKDSSNIGKTLTITTTYIGQFVYESKSTEPADADHPDYTDLLLFFGHEEGRVRYKPSVSTIAPSFVYDYFLKDHLGNVRAVLTDEDQTDLYPVASLETYTLAHEKLFYTIPDDASVRVHKSTVPGYPTDTYTNPNDFIHKLNGNGTKAGSSIVLKVMAGDKFNLRANSWYKTNGATPGIPVSPVTELLNALTAKVSLLSNKATPAQLSNDGSLLSGVNTFLTNQNSNNNNPAKPKAFGAWILFDEQFKYVSSSSGSEQVGER